MKVGVCNDISVVDFSGVDEYCRALAEKFRERRVAKKGTLLDAFEESGSRLSDAVERLGNAKRDNFFEELNASLGLFCRYSKECPQDIRDVFTEERKIGTATYRVPIRLNFFDSHIVEDLHDVVMVEKKCIAKRTWLFDIVTIKENGISDFKKKLQSIPPVSGKIVTKKEKRHFSMRYVFRPYPWAVKLWLDSDESITVPKDLKSFLNGAIRYYFSAEWRTSIVLSAIAVESVLADLYEEACKKPAPDSPLGDLFHKVKEKVKFPADVERAVEIANSARIAAVHRSHFPVSDREATNALFGAATFLLWCHSQP